MKRHWMPLVLICLLSACATKVDTRHAPAPEPKSDSPSAQAKPAPAPKHKALPKLNPPGDGELHGVDVSKYQGDVDFELIKNNGLHFVFIKASQGIDYVDPKFLTNFHNACNAGLVVGAYHYYMTNDDPAQQFENFKGVAPLFSGNLAPVVDIEALTKHDLPNWADDLQIFLNLLEDHFGARPIIYSGEHFADAYLERFGDYPLWLAEYRDALELPCDWATWSFWQWSQRCQVEGISGDVDCSLFNGDAYDFQEHIIP